MGRCISHYFCIFHEWTTAFFRQAISVWLITLRLMLPYTFLHVPGILETLQKLRCASIPFQESILARKLERIWKMYFIEVLLHHHFENGTLHQPLFLYFPWMNKWTAFFRQAISVWLITLRLMLPYTFLHVPGILETLQKLRCANIPFQESIVARKLERIWKMYFIEVLLHHHFENGTLHKPLFLYFPRMNKWTAFFRQAISVWLITLRLMLPYTFLHVPGILETLQKLRCANIPFQESIVARKLERIWKMYFIEVLLHHHFENGTLHKPLFLYFPWMNKWTAFFRQAISVWLITLRLMLPYTFLHVPGILETLQKLRCANIPFQESIVARKLERIWKMYFIEVLLHHHFENGTLHKPLFLYFPRMNKWTAFFRQAISVWLITLRLMLPYTFLHVPGILETLQKLRCANIPFQESIVARKLERIWKMYFIEVLLHHHFENGTLHKPLFLYFPWMNKWTAFFRQAISVWLITLRLMLPYTFLHVPGILETLQKLRCANIPFQESIVARKLERIWKMYFIEVLLHHHFENGTLHKPLFLYFPWMNKWTAFFRQAISVWLITLRLMLPYTFLHVPGILETLQKLRCEWTSGLLEDVF